MSNMTISFYPKRKIIAANPPTDQLYNINITLDQFERDINDKIKESESISGVLRAVYFASIDSFACQSFVDLSDPTQATIEELEMFFASTLAAENFEANNLDTDVVATYQRQGGWKPIRESVADKNIFGYSFTLRVVNE